LLEETGKNKQCLQAIELQLQTITGNMKVLNSNHQALLDK
jgi:hypothetical protein